MGIKLNFEEFISSCGSEFYADLEDTLQSCLAELMYSMEIDSDSAKAISIEVMNKMNMQVFNEEFYPLYVDLIEAGVEDLGESDDSEDEGVDF